MCVSTIVTAALSAVLFVSRVSLHHNVRSGWIRSGLRCVGVWSCKMCSVNDDDKSLGVIDARHVLADVIETLDQTWEQLDRRLDGITPAEYLWEPAPGCWSVHASGDGETAVADWREPEPDPAPPTTIAWRMWHIAVDCLDSYSRRRFDTSGTGLEGTQWVLDVGAARALLTQAWHGFRDPIAHGSPHQLMEPLGSAWGSYEHHSTLALALHAQREVTHHGAEIGLLRDLYRALPHA